MIDASSICLQKFLASQTVNSPVTLTTGEAAGENEKKRNGSCSFLNRVKYSEVFFFVQRLRLVCGNESQGTLSIDNSVSQSKNNSADYVRKESRNAFAI